MEDNKAVRVGRRGFIRDVLFTVSIMLVTLRIGANKKNLPETISCGSVSRPSPKSLLTSVKSGRWSDLSIWGGSLPSSNDIPAIAPGHTVIFDVEEATVAGLMISANSEFNFDPEKSTLLNSSGNVVVEGKLGMKPVSTSVKQTLRFIEISESAFEGGGMNVLDSDVGLWVMGAGVMDIHGKEKKSWTNAKAGIAKGSLEIEVLDSTGWQAGDDISIAPTASPTVGVDFSTGFDESAIQNVSKNKVTLKKAVGRAHPKVNDRWTAEVMNLTRNVKIEGTTEGRSHIFIRSSAKQNIQYAEIRYMGPRKDNNNDGVTELVPGRYGMHFHHCMDGSRGSVVEGNVIRDTNNHCYVPHVSHEILFRDNVSYNTLETAFWWDPGDSTHDVIYDHNIVAKCNFVNRSINMNSEGAPTFSSSGFGLNTGDDNICINNVVVGGGQGDFADGGAYNWEAVINEGVWSFSGNIAHNNDCGLRVWQNSTRNHIIEDFFAYNNGIAIFHGAYANSYTYNGGILYGNRMQIKAASVNSNRVRVENFLIDGAGIIDHGIEIIHSPLPGDRPILLRNLEIRNCRVASVIDAANPEVHSVDIIQCELQAPVILHPQSAELETIRVQPKNGEAFRITKTGTTTIEKFAPEVWGNGKGLKAEYFNGAEFNTPAFTRIDSNISFSEWSAGVHYAITGNHYSVRWTGQIQPQFTEDLILGMGVAGGCRLWLDNKLLISNWQETPSIYRKTAPIAVVAGKLYDIKVEYFNKERDTIAGLSWTGKSLPEEYVPQSQLYSGTPVNPPPTEPPVPPVQDTIPKVATIARNYIEVRSPDNSFYMLFDAAGRLLKKGGIIQGLNQIYVAGFPAGIFLLKLNNINKAFKVMKI